MMTTREEEERRLRLEEQEAAIARLLAGGPRPLEIPGECGRPITLLIHLDTYPARAGLWRLTRIDAEGAFGHTESSSWESAVRECRFWGGRYAEAREPGAVP